MGLRAAWDALWAPKAINPNKPSVVNDLSERARSEAGLPRPAETFEAQGSYPAGLPFLPSPINATGPAGLPAPRRWEYPVGFNLPTAPGATKLVDFRTLRTLADAEPILRRCIETRKQEVAQLDWQIVPRDRRDTSDYSEPIAALTRFFRTPDRINGIDLGDWIKMLLEEIFVVDALSVYRRPTRNGTLHSLQIVDGTTIKPLIDQWGNRPMEPAPAYQQFIQGLPRVDLSAGEEQPFDAEIQARQRGQATPRLQTRELTSAELVYRPYVRRSWTVYGFPNVEQIILTINLALKRLQWHTAFFTEGNIPEAYAEAPEGYTPRQIEEVQTLWDQLLAGDIAHQRRMHWVPHGTNFTEVRDATKVHVLEFDEYLLKVICAGMDVQPQEIGFTHDVNKAQGEMQEHVVYRKSLRPLSKWIGSLFDNVIEADFGLPELTFRFLGVEEAAEEKARAETDTKYVQSGVKTIDDVRVDRLGLPPLEDGVGAKPIIITGRHVARLEDVAAGVVQDLAEVPPSQALPTQRPVDKALGDYERFALSRIRRGRTLRPFESDDLSAEVLADVHGKLVDLQERDTLTTESVKAVFAQARTPTPVA